MFLLGIAWYWDNSMIKTIVVTLRVSNIIPIDWINLEKHWFLFLGIGLSFEILNVWSLNLI